MKFTYFKPTLLSLLSALLLVCTLSLNAQTTAKTPSLEGCIVTESGEIERPEMTRFKKLLHTHKDSMLYAIKTQSFEDLVSHTVPGINTYKYASYYRYLKIGNFFTPDKKHAVMLYLSDAYQTGEDDYRADLYIFEVMPNGIKQVLYIPKLSSYYREIAADVTDLDHDNHNELIVLTSEPEWGSTTKPAHEYYHRFLYDQNKDKFIRYKGFEQLANAIYINPNYLYTYETCGCSGDCWISNLYQQNGTSLYPIAMLEDRCVGVSNLFVVANSKKQLAAETIVTDRNAIPLFWQNYIQNIAAPKQP